MRTCLFGGSFDPVHEAHLAIAAAAQEACRLDRVVFLPAACSPFKKEGSALFSPECRLEMLRCATAGLPWAEVSDLDMRLPAPSWSWRLVEARLAEQPGEELYWLLGADQWALLHLWARPDYLAEHLTFIVCHRGDEPPPQPREGVRCVMVRGPELAISSSAIRAHLQQGLPLPPGHLNPEVDKLARKALHNSRN